MNESNLSVLDRNIILSFGQNEMAEKIYLAAREKISCLMAETMANQFRVIDEFLNLAVASGIYKNFSKQKHDDLRKFFVKRFLNWKFPEAKNFTGVK